ncbi:hypothetical protein [Kitasatospora sp. NPDC094011]
MKLSAFPRAGVVLCGALAPAAGAAQPSVAVPDPVVDACGGLVRD